MATNKSDNMNQGLPDHSGLDEGTRARLLAQAEGGVDGIKVGSFRDLQLGITDVPVEERPVNENVPEDANLVLPAEHDAMTGNATQLTAEEGLAVAGQMDYASMTKDDLQAEAENRGLATSGTKDELIARLEGR